MDTLLLDLRYAIRSLRRSPGFTALAVLTLGLGIGATTAGFSLLNRVLFRPVPGVRAPDRVGFVTISEITEHGNTAVGFNAGERARVLQAAPAIADIAGMEGPMQLGVAAPGAIPVIAQGAFDTPEYFRTLGVDPARGRLLDSADDVPPSGLHVAIISDWLWQGLYGGRPDILGAPLSVNGVPFTVVGVTPPGFRGPDRIEVTDFWLPGHAEAAVRHFAHWSESEITYYRNVLRLRPGASFDVATAQLKGVVRAISTTDTSRFTPSLTAVVVPGAGLEMGKGPLQHQLALIMGVAGLVLMVACANIANLLIFRRARRHADIVVRISLGAGPARLMRLFLIESGLIGVFGCVFGITIAVILRQAFGTITLLRWIDLGPIPFDTRVLIFAAASGVLASLVAGFIPAFLATRVDLGSDLKASARTQAASAPRLRVGLAVLQVAISLTLVAGAYLFAGTLRSYQRIPLGFNPDGVSVYRMQPQEMGFSQERQRAYYRSLTQRVSGLPGVQRVGLANLLPFMGIINSRRILPSGAAKDAKPEETAFVQVSGEYFAMLGIPLERGRTFADADLWPDSTSRIGHVILNAALARQLFGDRDPLGQLVDLPGRERNYTGQVIGVARDSRIDFTGSQTPMLYEPLDLEPDWYSPMLVVQSRVPDPTLTREVREAARSLDGSLPIDPRGPLTGMVAAAISNERLLFRVVGWLSALTLLLTAVGVYGIVAYGVTTRTREFGIRTALGAVPANLIQVALRPALIITAVGTLAGVAGALYLTKFIAASLYGVSRFDPLAFITAALVLAAAVLLASWLPARRAAKIDPMVALRYE